MPVRWKESHNRAVKKYYKKAYSRHYLPLRYDTDQDIINDIEKAKANGVSPTEWIRNVFAKSGE